VERGWKPTPNAVYIVRRPGLVGSAFRPSSGLGRIRPVRQEYFGSGAGEALVWEWEDGDPNTIDATVWVREAATGEEITADIQTEVSDYVEDVWERWHYVVGDRAGRDQEEIDRTREGRLVPVGGIRAAQSACDLSCRCSRLRCLRDNYGRIFKQRSGK
jgi:hypothetical protein